MTRTAQRMAMAFLLCSLTLPAWGQQYYLYEPKAVVPDGGEPTKDGVLVKEIPIRQGDTLYAISRKFSGHGTYYPQILLFNDIKNPNLIYTGDTLRIPLPHGETAEGSLPAATPRAQSQKSVKVRKQLSAALPRNVAGKRAKLPVSELEKTGGVKEPRADQNRSRPDLPLPVPEPHKADVSVQRTVAADGGQQLFEKAVKAYRQDDCRTALELFDRYLADYPASAMAADASLYKAECYLKLSTQ